MFPAPSSAYESYHLRPVSAITMGVSRNARPDQNLSVRPLTEIQQHRIDETIPQDFKLALKNRLTWLDLRWYLYQRSAPIFAYGSLQLPHEIARCLNKGKFNHDDEGMSTALSMTPGVITHHHVYAVQDSIFPGILEDGTEHDEVPGMVIFGLNATQRHLLDCREGSWYCREERDVNIVMSSGEDEVIRAHVYVWARGAQYLCDPDVIRWTLKEFIEQRKKAPTAKPTDEANEDAYRNLIKANPDRYALPPMVEYARHLEWLASYDRRFERRIAIQQRIREREAAAMLAQQRGEENIYGISSSDSESALAYYSESDLESDLESGSKSDLEEPIRNPKDSSEDDSESFKSQEELVIHQETASENHETSQSHEEPVQDHEEVA